MDAFRPRPGLGKVMAAPVDGGDTGEGEDGSRQRDNPQRLRGSGLRADLEPAFAW